MTCYLQPSPARELLDATIEWRHREHVLHPIQYELGVRVRFLGAAGVGMTQVVHCFAVWVILSMASVLSLGLSDQVERLADRAQSLCGAGIIAVAIAIVSIVDTPAAERISQKISAFGDRQIAQLRKQFGKELDVTAAEVRKSRQLTAKWLGETERREFFDQALKAMRKARQLLIQDCIRRYPKGTTDKHDALTRTQAQMYEMQCFQRMALWQVPYTQTDVDRDFVNRTLDMADEALVELYRYPKQVLVERIQAWGSKWDREGFQEWCIKLFRKHQVDHDVANLVDNVKGSDAKERAFKRFVIDINALVRREKKQIDKAERPGLFKRIQWNLAAWLNSEI